MKNIFHDKTISIMQDIYRKGPMSLQELHEIHSLTVEQRLNELKSLGYIQEYRFETEPIFVYDLTEKGHMWLEDFNSAKIQSSKSKKQELFFKCATLVLSIIATIISIIALVKP